MKELAWFLFGVDVMIGVVGGILAYYSYPFI